LKLVGRPQSLANQCERSQYKHFTMGRLETKKGPYNKALIIAITIYLEDKLAC
jgi:hypothetical protein